MWRMKAEGLYPHRFWLRWLLLLAVMFPLVAAHARSGRFRILEANTTLIRGVYYLDADLSLQLNHQAEEALHNGVPLTFLLQVHIQHRQWLFWNHRIASLTQRYRLTYKPLTQRYRLSDLSVGVSNTFETEGGALAALSQVYHLPLIDADLLSPHTRYEVAMRVVLDTNELPGPLRFFAFILPDWRLASPWKQWVLQN